jgi:hypothetical protein
MTLPGLEPKDYRSRDEHVLWRSNSNTTIVIDFDLTLPRFDQRPTVLETSMCQVKDYNNGINTVTSSLNMLVSRTVGRWSNLGSVKSKSITMVVLLLLLH